MKLDNRIVRWARTREGMLTLVFSLTLFIVAFALYARTMAPGLLEADEGEFQINIFRLGVSHTGYPSFFLLGKLWTLLIPIGTVATRANLFSVFWGALAVVALYIFIRFMTQNHWVSVVTALLFIASRVEWSQAIIPRPYTMNSLFVILVTFLFFLWRMGKVDLTVPIFAVGLSLTGHRTMMWFVPAIGLFILIADFRASFADQKPTGSLVSIVRQWFIRSTLFKPRRLLSIVVAFILPLLLYAYVFWRGESDVGVEFHWKDFNDEIMGGYVRASWRFGPVDWLVSRVTDLYIPMLIEQYTVLGFIAGLVGILALAFNRPPRGYPRQLPARETLLFIVLANLANTAFCVIFWVIDIDKFFLPSFITFLFLTGIGLATMGDWFATRPWRQMVQAAVVIAGVVATVFLVSQNYAVNDFSNRTDAVTIWEENLSQPLEKNAVIAGSWESLTPLEYAMYVDGKRGDLDRWKIIIKNYQLGQVPYGSRQEDIERAVREGRPLYLTAHPNDTETLNGLVDEFRLTRVGELWRVLNLPPLASAPPFKSSAIWQNPDGGNIELLGYSTYPSATLHSGDFGLLTLFWRAPQSLNSRLTVSFRLMDTQGQVVYQRDMEPASGLRPTIGWAPNEVVQDDIGFFVPPNVSPGVYQAVIVVYNPIDGTELHTSTKETTLPIREINVINP